MIKFGTGGWRAIIGDEFIKSNVLLLAQALSKDLHRKNKAGDGFVIGYDRRFLSRESAVWVAEVLAANDIPVYFIDDIAPTPMIMYAVKQMSVHYGVAITASHNPAAYNGVKIFTEGGRDATKDVTDDIEVILNELKESDVKSLDFKTALESRKVTIIKPFNEYIDNILNMVDIDAIKEKQLKILLDPMYGVSKTSLQTILLTARCEVELIHDRHDTLFGGRLPSPTAVTLHQLRNKVIEKGYDLGIGTDGDADRIGLIDEKGNFIHPNDIMAMLYNYLMTYKGWKGPVVRNIATTHLLDTIAKDHGEVCYEVPVGFKHISSKMEEKDAIIGGESSGGLTIRGHIKGKDGIFASALLVEMICVTGKSLAELKEDLREKYGQFEMAEKDYSFDASLKSSLKHQLYEQKELPEFPYAIEKISYEDGVKVYFENGGWIIARFSGTEPLIRIFAEMDELVKAEELCIIMREFLGIGE